MFCFRSNPSVHFPTRRRLHASQKKISSISVRAATLRTIYIRPKLQCFHDSYNPYPQFTRTSPPHPTPSNTPPTPTHADKPPQFTYRLSTCPELSLGIFSTLSSPPPPTTQIPTYASATPPDSHSPSKKSVLIAMIIATKTTSPAVTDASIDFPPNWQHPSSAASSPGPDPRGHHENGRTIALHTLAVLPAFQGRGLARTIMKSYEQRMETSGIADRIALLAHEPLVPMYVGMGFEDRGKSECTFGGGGWNRLVWLLFLPFSLL